MKHTLRLNAFATGIYPALVGLLLGLLQTGLFLQLTFTLSSGFGTYLMVTLCWLLGSALGVVGLARLLVPTGAFLALTLASCGICAALLHAVPFDTDLWPLYAGLIIAAGWYPGVFFQRAGRMYCARVLFFCENNGFIAGLTLGTLLFLVSGRAALWIAPLVTAAAVALVERRLARLNAA